MHRAQSVPVIRHLLLERRVSSNLPACIAPVLLWFVGFTVTWYNVGNTAAFEIPSIELRGYTLSWSALISGGFNAMLVFVSPYIQNPQYANLGGKIGYICKPLSGACQATDRLTLHDACRRRVFRRGVRVCLLLHPRAQGSTARSRRLHVRSRRSGESVQVA